MSDQQDHPDDQTDDIEILRENLRHVRRRLAEREHDLAAADALVTETRQSTEKQGELFARWIEVFDMELDTDGKWIFDRDQTELWTKYDELLDRNLKLLRDWNRFVPKYNATFADERPPRGKGRPRAASEAQQAEVIKLRQQGLSYGAIVDATGLSAKTVRTITTAPIKAAEERQKLKRQILNKEAAARYRARLRGRALLETEINDSAKRQAALIKAAKGLGRD